MPTRHRRLTLAEPSAVAHQFDDIAQQHDAGQLGMWTFLVTEIMFFGGMIIAYIVYRSFYPEAFAAGSHHLDITLGCINTVVLIGSSLTMAMAVYAAQIEQRSTLVLYLLATLGLGLIFLGIKTVEYTGKFESQLVPGPGFHFEGAHAKHVELFFSLYFVMTGMHALHMMIGMGLLGVFAWQAKGGRFSATYNAPIEFLGLYWHFVDIVWIFLFPLFYLLGRH
jgi:cytochrome c oxidase subunit III